MYAWHAIVDFVDLANWPIMLETEYKNRDHCTHRKYNHANFSNHDENPFYALFDENFLDCSHDHKTVSNTWNVGGKPRG